MTRSIWYITGTRADYGLMQATLRAIDGHPGLNLGLLVTGMHLDPACGETIREIETDGFRIIGRITAHEPTHSGAAMARGIGRMIGAFTDAMEAGRPDVVLLLGDRGEMLAAAIAAVHLNIPVAHIHGGERSGTVDEPVRHAISKLSHLHLVATEEARERLRRMGERPDAIHVVGAPGLVGLTELAYQDRTELAVEAGLDPKGAIALFVYHPVLQEAEMSGQVAMAILDALASFGYQTVALKPNSDGGSEQIRAVLDAHAGHPAIIVATHFDRKLFASWMAVADVIIGNSSAGIIEAASFGTPVINVGGRQAMRLRNGNVRDVGSNRTEIFAALSDIRPGRRFAVENVYGDGKSDERIAQLLAEVGLVGVTWKCNAY